MISGELDPIRVADDFPTTDESLLVASQGTESPSDCTSDQKHQCK